MQKDPKKHKVKAVRVGERTLLREDSSVPNP